MDLADSTQGQNLKMVKSQEFRNQLNEGPEEYAYDMDFSARITKVYSFHRKGATNQGLQQA